MQEYVEDEILKDERGSTDRDLYDSYFHDHVWYQYLEMNPSFREKIVKCFPDAKVDNQTIVKTLKSLYEKLCAKDYDSLVKTPGFGIILYMSVPSTVSQIEYRCLCAVVNDGLGFSSDGVVFEYHSKGNDGN